MRQDNLLFHELNNLLLSSLVEVPFEFTTLKVLDRRKAFDVELGRQCRLHSGVDRRQHGAAFDVQAVYRARR